MNNSRRNFIKKAAYVAPAVVAIGTLTTPTTSNASSKISKTKVGRPTTAD